MKLKVLLSCEARDKMDLVMPSHNNLFAIGDIHGCAQELKLLLNKLPLQEDSTIVFLGDYIDRGESSKEVVDTLLELKKQANVITLQGNHESMLLQFLENPESNEAGLFIYNGGSATLASYADAEGNYSLPQNHLEFFSTLPIYYETSDYFFVHAGVPEMDLDSLKEDPQKEDLLWIREPFLHSRYLWGKTIVHGHTPVRNVDIRKNRINLDTGCVYEGMLSAIRLPDQTVFSVRKQKKLQHVYLRSASSRRRAVRFSGTIPVYIQNHDQLYEFETLDYNEFGVYVRDILHHEKAVLKENQPIRGNIGSEDHMLVEFEGKIVRVDKNPQGVFYAIQILNRKLKSDGVF